VVVESRFARRPPAPGWRPGGTLGFPDHGSPGTAARPARARTGPPAPATPTSPPR